MYSEKNRQISLWGSPLYERIIPKDHFLMKLDKVVNFNKINDFTRHLYSRKMGRPSWEPALLFRITLLQFMYDISDRRVEEEVRYNMAYKCFVGLNAEDDPPDHTTLSVFRDRLGADKFEKIFNMIVEGARVKGLVSDRLQVIDSTAIEAKVDILKFNKAKREEENDDDENNKTKHPEKDARWDIRKKMIHFLGINFMQEWMRIVS